MNHSSKELKAHARASLLGHYKMVVFVFLLYLLISVTLSGISGMVFPLEDESTFSSILRIFLQFLISLLLQVFYAGFLKITLCISRGEPMRVEDLMYGFTHGADRFLLTSLVFSLCTSLTTSLPLSLATQYFQHSLPQYEQLQLMTLGEVFTFSFSYSMITALIGIAGSLFCILFTLSLSMTYYLLIDHADYTAAQALSESIRSMKGHMGRYFYLRYISFIGISLAAILSFGIGLLWIEPYMLVTSAAFYRDLNQETLSHEPV